MSTLPSQAQATQQAAGGCLSVQLAKATEPPVRALRHMDENAALHVTLSPQQHAARDSRLHSAHWKRTSGTKPASKPTSWLAEIRVMS